MNDDVLSYLSKKIQEELRIIEEDMAMGKADDFGAYKYACGIYRGLLIANGVVADLAITLENDDD
tara:strand:+ start:454 stop:648 length:195 start_codon:yes stop_codon:yes gene_type:complete